jgi:microcystin degradation protein MlrC
LSHLYIKTNILPRQARDKHKESTQKRVAFFAGGGGTSDSIVILSEMLERGVTSCVIATIVDPAVAEEAHAAGERAHT